MTAKTDSLPGPVFIIRCPSDDTYHIGWGDWSRDRDKALRYDNFRDCMQAIYDCDNDRILDLRAEAVSE